MSTIETQPQTPLESEKDPSVGHQTFQQEVSSESGLGDEEWRAKYLRQQHKKAVDSLEEAKFLHDPISSTVGEFNNNLFAKIVLFGPRTREKIAVRRAAKHYRKHQAAYNEQAIRDARKDGVEIN